MKTYFILQQRFAGKDIEDKWEDTGPAYTDLYKAIEDKEKYQRFMAGLSNETAYGKASEETEAFGKALRAVILAAADGAITTECRIVKRTITDEVVDEASSEKLRV